jgi:hypothetical protein
MASEGPGPEDCAGVKAGQRDAKTAIVFNHLVKYEAGRKRRAADRQPASEDPALRDNPFRALNEFNTVQDLRRNDIAAIPN